MGFGDQKWRLPRRKTIILKMVIEGFEFPKVKDTYPPKTNMTMEKPIIWRCIS